MNNKLLKKYAPYKGSEPFIFLCFSEKDTKGIEPLLSGLYRRGCRVWYAGDESNNIAQEAAVQARLKEAKLVIAYCTPDFHNSSAKSRMMFLQAKNIPVITVDKEPTDNLSAGTREGTPHIKAYNGITDNTLAELICTDGFSYEFIGERPSGDSSGHSQMLTVSVVIMAVLVAVALLFNVLAKNGCLSSEQVNNEIVESIVLEKLPEDISELETEYPELKKITVPKSEAESSDIEQYMDKYTVVITEG